jgi:hypothetical protein
LPYYRLWRLLGAKNPDNAFAESQGRIIQQPKNLNPSPEDFPGGEIPEVLEDGMSVYNDEWSFRRKAGCPPWRSSWKSSR